MRCVLSACRPVATAHRAGQHRHPIAPAGPWTGTVRNPPAKEEARANIPGAVTDPSRVKGEEIRFQSGSDSVPGYLARPSR